MTHPKSGGEALVPPVLSVWPRPVSSLGLGPGQLSRIFPGQDGPALGKCYGFRPPLGAERVVPVDGFRALPGDGFERQSLIL